MLKTSKRKTSKLGGKKTKSRVTRSDTENRRSISHNTFNCLKDISSS